jgi:hypothetical protein
MKKFLFLGIVCLLLVAEYAAAQKLTEKEHLKYWYYRHRLLEEFVIIGEAPSYCEGSGLSIPALSAVQYNAADKLKLVWVDNPIAGLGHYIGVLATELKLLYLTGEPYENTQQELYYAMKAYERLDINCECLFYPKKLSENDGVLNGLFCRDDVPIEFMFDSLLSGIHQEFRDRNGYTEFIASTYKKQINEVEHEISDPLDITLYPSLEEWEGMLTGFALLVNALYDCPADVVIFNNYRFIEEAIMHTKRFMDRMEGNYWVGKLTNGEIYAYGEELLLGQELYGLAKAADFICSAPRPYAVNLTFNPIKHYAAQFQYNNPVVSVPLYAYILSRGLLFNGISILELAINGNLPGDLPFEFQKYFWLLYGNPYSIIAEVPSVGYVLNDHMINENVIEICFPPCLIIDTLTQGHHWVASSMYTLAAIGNSWTDVYNNNEDITYESLVTYTNNFNWDWYPLLNLYLQNKNKEAGSLRQKMVFHLLNAPIQGPHYLPLFSPAPSLGTVGWRAGYKWGATLEQANEGFNTSDDAKGAKFPGFDYMLAYNLLRLECIQKGLEDDYFETAYTNERDKAYSIYHGSQADTYYKHGDLILQDTYFSTNTNLSAEDNISLESNVEFPVGINLSLEIKPKLTLEYIKGISEP